MRILGNVSTFQKNRTIYRSVLLGCLIFAVVSLCLADPGKNQPGRPLGVYDLSDLESMNLFNGSLTFNLPLLTIHGRGSFGYTISIGQQNLISTFDQQLDIPCDEYNTPPCGPYVRAQIYNDGATGGFQPLHIQLDSQNEFDQSGGPNTYIYSKSFSYCKLTMPDGTVHPLYDEATSGARFSGVYTALHQPGFLRGRRFSATDGSNITFISDTDIRDFSPPAPPTGANRAVSGYVLYPDGTRFRIDTSTVSWVQDVDGNRTTFEYSYTNNLPSQLTGITDSSGRHIQFAYAQNAQTGESTSTITYLGSDGSPQSIVVRTNPMHLALRPAMNGYPAAVTQTPYQLYGDYGMYLDNTPVDPPVPTEVEFPTGKKYDFFYDSFGELSLVNLPNGGMVSYEYGSGFGEGQPYNQGGIYSSAQRLLVNRRIKERRVHDASQNVLNLTKYETAMNSTAPGIAYRGYATEETYIPDISGSMTRTSRTNHYYYGNPIRVWPADLYFYDGGLYNAWNDGKEYKTELFGSDGVTLLRSTETNWQQLNNTSVSWWSPSSQTPEPAHYPRVTSQLTHIFEQGTELTSETRYAYDDSNTLSNKTDEWTYDFGVGAAPGALMRHTQQEYLSINPENGVDYRYDGVHILSLPTRTKNFSVAPDGTETLVSQAEVKYDETLYPTQVYDEAAVGWQDPQNLGRGKATTSRVLNINQGTWLDSHTQFDQFGNARKKWEPTWEATRFVALEYSSAYNYAYPTRVTTPGPDPTDITGTAESSSTSTTYNQFTGLPEAVTDEFGQTTTTEYDQQGRPVHIIPPANGAEKQIEYGDALGNLFVRTRTQLDAQNWSESTSFLDCFGRQTLQMTADAEGDVSVSDHYDGLGRLDRVTNPYRSNDTVYWNKTRFDDLGRPVESYAPETLGNIGNAQSLGTTTFGISTVPGTVGTVVTTTDAAGRKSRSITNSLGQLIRVDEPTGIGGTADIDLGSLSTPNQATLYSYSPQGWLVHVQQGVQNRFFLYDSMGRVKRVRQPEQEVNSLLNLNDPNTGNSSWTAAFTYDALGNVLTATDAKGTVITNMYDRANRITSRTYSNEPGGVSTPAVSFYYDGKGLSALQSPNFAKSQLTKVTSAISETQYQLFDNFGRLTQTSQITDGQTYTSTYTYRLNGQLLTETYPSGRTVTNEYASDGDLSKVTSQKNPSSVSHRYVSNLAYTATGGISRMRLGNGTWENAQFNSLDQLTELGLGRSSTDNSLWKVDYEYGELDATGNTITAKNTGNISKQILTVPGANFIQTDRYDPLYRLTNAAETSGGNTNWSQVLTYDRFGNRLTQQKQVGGVSTSGTPSVDPYTNRFNANQGFVYDKNGNVIQDMDSVSNEQRSFTFDGNNKETEIRDANGNTIARYFFDGEGKRVKKEIVATGETTIFVYASGKLVAEYSTTIASPAEAKIAFPTTDHLGTPRVIVDQYGSVRSRRDLMPFGEEIPVASGDVRGGIIDHPPPPPEPPTLGGVDGDDGDVPVDGGGGDFGPPMPPTIDNGGTGRTSSLNYLSGADGVRQRFTGYEKDDETSQDFAEARIYENRYGRFTAVDPLLASGKSSNPQSFNRFAYVGNNPLGFTDPSGLDWYQLGDRYRWSDDNLVFRDGSSVGGWNPVKFDTSGFLAYDCAGCSESTKAYLYQTGGWDYGQRVRDTPAQPGSVDLTPFFDGFSQGLDDTKTGAITGLENVPSTVWNAATTAGSASLGFAQIRTGQDGLPEIFIPNPFLARGYSYANQRQARIGQQVTMGALMAPGVAAGPFARAASLTILAEQPAAETSMVGGGAKFSNLTPSEIRAIQRFADKRNVDVTVVGSRAGGTADAAASDFDYIIGGNSRIRNYAQRELPRGVSGGAYDNGIDVLPAFRFPLDRSRPYLTFSPRPSK